MLLSGFPRIPNPLMGGVELEGIANRDSIPYRATYGLQDATSLRTLVRGTLRSVKVLNIESRFSSIYHFRYPGFCTLMQSFKYLGLLEDHEKITIDSWSAFLPRALSVRAKAFSVSDVYMHSGSLETVMREVAPWDQFSKTSGKLLSVTHLVHSSGWAYGQLIDPQKT